MKFVTISDTHGAHKNLVLPKGDVLIHAGDISKRGTKYEVEDFLAWFAALDFEHKIFIAGNHDFFFEKASEQEIQSILPKEVTYLDDSGIRINNTNIWGSPVTPWFFDWAFNRQRGQAIAEHWGWIPANTHILVTHGPIQHVLDRTIDGKHVGCEELEKAVARIQPSVHICGHIHEAYGQVEKDNTLFINASVLNVRYVLTNQPIVFDR